MMDMMKNLVKQNATLIRLVVAVALLAVVAAVLQKYMPKQVGDLNPLKSSELTGNDTAEVGAPVESQVDATPPEEEPKENGGACGAAKKAVATGSISGFDPDSGFSPLDEKSELPPKGFLDKLSDALN